MIQDGGAIPFSFFQQNSYDWFFYGLGFETRATKVASHLPETAKILAIKMPELNLHSYRQNLHFAHTRKHIIVDNLADMTNRIRSILLRSRPPLKLCFDISSVNRVILAESIAQIARYCRADDVIDIVYCPAAYREPDWHFPQIERVGPINATFSSIESDLNKPLCLLLGAGFDAGIALGLISQLEPRVSYCFWGAGVDTRFDRAVRRANFNFDFGGFNTKSIAYNIKDPKGAFAQIESIVYGLARTHRIVVIPMGPKLFTLLATLVGMAYLGDVAVWRVQHSTISPPDSLPGDYSIRASLDVEALCRFEAREKMLFSQELTA